MRYTTEFKIAPDAAVMDKNLDQRIEYLKKANAAEIGQMIKALVEFEELETGDPGKHFKLDIQAFDSKDWSYFKSQMKEYIEKSQGGLSTFNLIVIGKMFRELEEKGMEKAKQYEAQKQKMIINNKTQQK